ncbi:Coronin-like protein crn1 [Apiospora rasikravindrae]|uniref:Coronin n=1 Tax=Apiospora rasikravindrae TaxID=990691 RepID=A0ABR1RWM4_9PEZI
MSGRFVRASKYRHVFGKSTRKEFCYDNLRISRNAWDTNLIKANPEYLSCNWEASGGGAFAVIPLNEKGKVPELIPLFRGHTSAVLDTDWNPFNDRIVASASDDGKVMIWEVPKDFTLFTDAEEPADVSPVAKFGGHSRKVGQVLFNPAAENILASASGDLTIKLWDVNAGSASLSLKHPDIVQSLSWNASGSMLVTTSRDKKVRVWDARQERPASEHSGHEGAKNSRVVWLGEQNRFATTGFSKMSDRQLALWEPGNTTPIGGFHTLDSISGVCMPFWDDSCNCLYLAGKGDGNIRYFEYENDKFEFLSEYKSGDPQRGVAFLPKRGVNVSARERGHEGIQDCQRFVHRAHFIHGTATRRNLPVRHFPPAVGLKPAMSTQEWLSGKEALPPKINFEDIYEGNPVSEVPADFKPAPAPAPAPAAKPAPKKEPEPAPAPAAARSPPPSMRDQGSSIAAMASKYEDDDAAGDDDETSSFEEISKPVSRKPVSPTKTTSAPLPKPAALKSPTLTSPSTFSPTTASAPAPSSSLSSNNNTSTPAGVQNTLTEIKQLLETQTKMISSQGQQIVVLTGEVDSLKKRVGSGSQDQSERIRQLELELESLRP